MELLVGFIAAIVLFLLLVVIVFGAMIGGLAVSVFVMRYTMAIAGAVLLLLSIVTSVAFFVMAVREGEQVGGGFSIGCGFLGALLGAFFIWLDIKEGPSAD